MKISAAQLHMLLFMLQDSLKMEVEGYLSLSKTQRTDLLNAILGQQNDKLVIVK